MEAAGAAGESGRNSWGQRPTALHSLKSLKRGDNDLGAEERACESSALCMPVV